MPTSVIAWRTVNAGISGSSSATDQVSNRPLDRFGDYRPGIPLGGISRFWAAMRKAALAAP